MRPAKVLLSGSKIPVDYGRRGRGAQVFDYVVGNREVFSGGDGGREGRPSYRNHLAAVVQRAEQVYAQVGNRGDVPGKDRPN